MKIIVEGTPKEIAALVLELQERQTDGNFQKLEADGLGIKLCADDILENK